MAEEKMEDKLHGAGSGPSRWSPRRAQCCINWRLIISRWELRAAAAGFVVIFTFGRPHDLERTPRRVDQNVKTLRAQEWNFMLGNLIKSSISN